jgi:cysteine desulfuration protein SufE
MSATATTSLPPAADEILENLGFLDDWEQRYRYIIELGQALPPLEDTLKTEATKVKGCASQVWLVPKVSGAGAAARLDFQGDSDAHIVKGLVAITLALYSGRSAADIMATDAKAYFASLGLAQHLTAQRSNGLFSMVERIRSDARAALG